MHSSNRYPPELAAFYDSRHGRGSVGDEAFYVDAATNVDGPVLEAACGTGRLYLELRRRGVDVDGFDVSRPMLARLREKAAANDREATVWQADLRSVTTDCSYALALVPYNSLCNLTRVVDQIDALDALHDVLEPGGRLLFDAFVPRYDVVADGFGEWQDSHRFEHDGRQLEGRTRASLADQVEQTYRTEHEIRDLDGRVVTSETFTVAHLPPQQVELLARHSNFRNWCVRGGFEDARGVDGRTDAEGGCTDAEGGCTDADGLADGDDVQVWELVK